MRTTVRPDGNFVFAIHKPSYHVQNIRTKTEISSLGLNQHQHPVDNKQNFPEHDLEVANAEWIYEICNPFPFRGTTFIGKRWADRNAQKPENIRLPQKPEVSLSKNITAHNLPENLFSALPRPLILSLATTSTDPDDLVRLAHMAADFTGNPKSAAFGLCFTENLHGRNQAVIKDHLLFEAVANNPFLPDQYKIAMVIRPGAQGDSEIVGDFHQEPATHIYEYLRRNSYIGGGHYAANMAENAIRYAISDLSKSDIGGLRHLYYQRTYLRLAEQLGITVDITPSGLSSADLETLRLQITTAFNRDKLENSATLWGWNFGFDYAPSGYRLHASHQQVHQQYALIPETVETFQDDGSLSCGRMPAFSCGDMISEVINEYRRVYNSDFFKDYLKALETNKRMDQRNDRENSLVVWEDARVILFVPKAQTSQWELQIMTKPSKDGCFPGNILETETSVRASLDQALLKAQQALAGRGARMVTSIEYSKRFNDAQTSQPLIYSLLPKLPESPGAFSENQLRFINGHYPEDFAAVCRHELKT